MSEAQKEDATSESTQSKAPAKKSGTKEVAPNGAILMQGGIYRIDHGKGDK